MDKEIREAYIQSVAPAMISALKESSLEKFGDDSQAVLAMHDAAGVVYTGLFRLVVSEARTVKQQHEVASGMLQRLVGFLTIASPNLDIQFRVLSKLDPEAQDD